MLDKRFWRFLDGSLDGLEPFFLEFWRIIPSRILFSPFDHILVVAFKTKILALLEWLVFLRRSAFSTDARDTLGPLCYDFFAFGTFPSFRVIFMDKASAFAITTNRRFLE